MTTIRKTWHCPNGILMLKGADCHDKAGGNQSIIVMVIGLVSSVIDNVPLVAATQGMYDLSLYPTDSFLWEFLAYCAGTGGSILIIGSAAGVAAMGMEKINFFFKAPSKILLPPHKRHIWFCRHTRSRPKRQNQKSRFYQCFISAS